jgi:hypothetical protein
LCYAVILLLIFLSRADVFAQGADSRVSATWQVQKYDIAVNLPADPNGRSVDIVALVEVKNVSGRPANSLTLRVSPLAENISARINGSVVDPSRSEEKLGGGVSIQRLMFRMPSVGAGEKLSAEISYRLTIRENSGLSSLSPAGTHFLPLSFWYPTPNSWYFPRGADRAPFSLKISGAQMAVSAGGLSDGKFDLSAFGEPFFLTGSWERSSIGKVSMFIPQGIDANGKARAAELAKLYEDAVAFCESKLGRAPAVPLRIISSRRGGGFSSGGSLIIDEAVFRRPKLDSLTVLNVAEAAARLWFGGSTRIDGDGFGAISEGLPRFLADMFIEERFGRPAADAERLRQRTSYGAISRRAPAITAISPLMDVYYPVVANKGAMIWRIIFAQVGDKQFFETLRKAISDGHTDLNELRIALPVERELLEYFFDKQTDVNLLAGLPRVEGGKTRIALRNTGSIPVEVEVRVDLEGGKSLSNRVALRPTSFGEAVFDTTAKVIRAEIDAEKVYPQTDYSDDVAPRETTDNDPIIAAKRPFDRQEFAEAERVAQTLLRNMGHVDDIRIILARSLLAQNKIDAAKREFRSVLDAVLPSPRSMAWALVGLADIAQRSGDAEKARELATAAVISDLDYGAGLAARSIRNKLGAGGETDAAVRSFFAEFDRAASSNRKADLEALAVPGEVTRFINGIAGSTETWKTAVNRIDRLDANSLYVETELNVRLLGRSDESGMAVYRLVRVGEGWRLAGVEVFEVR